jgi:hypothetical protein
MVVASSAAAAIYDGVCIEANQTAVSVDSTPFELGLKSERAKRPTIASA